MNRAGKPGVEVVEKPLSRGQQRALQEALTALDDQSKERQGEPVNPFLQAKVAPVRDDNTLLTDPDENFGDPRAKPIVPKGTKKSFALIKGEVDLENERQRKLIMKATGEQLQLLRKKIQSISKDPLADLDIEFS